VGIETEREYSLLGQRFVVGESFAREMRALEKDVTENLRQLHRRGRQADWVIVSLHCHDVGGATFLTARKQSEVEEWASFARDLPAVVSTRGQTSSWVTGPHYTLGVELYRGKPIFHSLGNLVMEGDTVRFSPPRLLTFRSGSQRGPNRFLRQPEEKNDTQAFAGDLLFWNPSVPCAGFLRKPEADPSPPIDLGHGRPRSQRGRPLLADEEKGRKIIDAPGASCQKPWHGNRLPGGWGLYFNAMAVRFFQCISRPYV